MTIWRCDASPFFKGNRVRLKTARHHWWPESLSKFWAAKDGCVTRVSPNGSLLRNQPHKFGFTKNAHHLQRNEDSPWNASFEGQFGSADSSFPHFARWLLELQPERRLKGELFERLVPLDLSKEHRKRLAECCASLIVRSPRSKNKIKITIESIYAVDSIHLPIDKTLIAANMANSLPVFTRAIDQGGKFILLTSDGPEFIWGDGFLHNFPIGTDQPLRPFFVTPILPDISLVFVRPAAYRTKPEFMSLHLRENEAEFFNRTIQVYSCNEIYYRNDAPKLTEEFRKGQFLEYEYDQHPWLESLVSASLQVS